MTRETLLALILLLALFKLLDWADAIARLPGEYPVANLTTKNWGVKSED